MNLTICRLRTLCIFGAIAILSHCSEPSSEPPPIVDDIAVPKNVILLIGDGMGLSQVSSALYFQDSTSNFERFPVIGLIKNSSSSDKITDSAAGATAFSCGKKSYNGAIGVGPDSTDIENILEKISNLNLRTGLIATSSITHATPASFYAHVKSRDLEEDIAKQLINANIDFFAGGGKKFFNQRKDGLNLINELEANNLIVDTTGLADPGNLSADEKYGYLLAANDMPKVSEGRGNYLENASRLALDYLSNNQDGFFLMIEGSQIDWGGHDNDGDYLISELLDFDRTIGMVLDYQESHPNTLVIVTADHETGGFTLSSKHDPSTGSSDYNTIDPSFSTGGHSATMIPVFAKGEGSEEFGGVYENTDIFHKILHVTNW